MTHFSAGRTVSTPMPQLPLRKLSHPAQTKSHDTISPTARELEVLRVYVAKKGSRTETGDALGLSPNTVHTQVQRAYEKIGADCLLDAAEWLRRHPAGL